MVKVDLIEYFNIIYYLYVEYINQIAHFHIINIQFINKMVNINQNQLLMINYLKLN